MTTPYPDGYIPARNVLTGNTATPEQRAAAQSVLDRIEAQRRARMAPLADLRTPPDPQDMWGRVLVAVAATAFIIIMAVNHVWGI